MTKKVALYVRTSTENQKESIRLQQEEIEGYCQSKGYDIYDSYVDFGFLGKNANRPAFQNMMQAAEDRKFDMVLVTKVDRFAKSITDCLVNVEKLRSNGISFATTSQPINTSSIMGKLTLNIMDAFADFEREIIRERMEAGRKAAEGRGVVCHRPRKEIQKKSLIELIEKGLSANAAAKVLEVDPATITKRLHEYGYNYVNGNWVCKNPNTILNLQL